MESTNETFADYSLPLGSAKLIDFPSCDWRRVAMRWRTVKEEADELTSQNTF